MRECEVIFSRALSTGGQVYRLAVPANLVPMEFSEKMAFQMGGDAYGYRNKITYTMSEHEVEVIDLH